MGEHVGDADGPVGNGAEGKAGAGVYVEYHSSTVHSDVVASGDTAGGGKSSVIAEESDLGYAHAEGYAAAPASVTSELSPVESQ